MAREDTGKLRSQKSCFPSCFGFSRNVSGRKRYEDRDCVSGRKRVSLSWPRFRRRNSGRRTVPVDAAIAEKLMTIEIEEEVRDLRESVTAKRSPAVVASRVFDEKGRKGKISDGGNPQSEGRTFKSEHRKDLYNSASPETNQSRPGSLPTNPDRLKPAGNSQPFDRNPIVGNSGSISRTLVLLVALAVVVVWGRIGAIVCTSAWLYFIFRLRTRTNSDGIASNRKNISTPKIDSTSTIGR